MNDRRIKMFVSKIEKGKRRLQEERKGTEVEGGEHVLGSNEMLQKGRTKEG
jgi:hypothetical protein